MTSRTPNSISYYVEEDYNDVLTQLPTLINEAEKRAGEVLEPTIAEKMEIMGVIKDFIRSRKRKIYGGTALNEAIKLVNPDDAIYNEYNFKDIEFYSTKPILDAVDLCDILYKKNYKYVKCREAQHEETYTIFVNFQLYCDISYMPTRVFNGVKTITIDGIFYVHPHFALIDYLRMINQPLTAAASRWEKAFKRMYLLLKNYPLEYFDKKMIVSNSVKEIDSYVMRIKKEFMADEDVKDTCMITGFAAYNFYIGHAVNSRTVEQQARNAREKNNMKNSLIAVPYLEFMSVNYYDTVERLYKFIKEIVDDPKGISLDEYYPLFQFTGYSVKINYKGSPVAVVYQADGYCIPYIKTTVGYSYVSFQYLLMHLLIRKFESHLEQNRDMYFTFGSLIGSLVSARNLYLDTNNLGVINNSVFGEFRIPCIGSTMSYQRSSLIRNLEKFKRGKQMFSYDPDRFFSSKQEQQNKFDPTRARYKNTSGNKIYIAKNLAFGFDLDNNLIRANDMETDYSETDSEDQSDSVTEDTNDSTDSTN